MSQLIKERRRSVSGYVVGDEGEIAAIPSPQVVAGSCLELMHML